MLDTPVLFLIFNRPETTRQVFETIRKVRPRQLFVVSDGPRLQHPDDVDKVNLAREIASNVDWDCEVKTLYREQNLGCGRGPAEGISWFFEQVEEGIVLEDDCLPDPFFYEFCSSLLKHYRSHAQIAHISGNNFQNGVKRGNGSYYFSAYSHNWGWASWRSRWRAFRYSISDFDEIQLRSKLRVYGFNKEEITFWISAFRGLEKQPLVDVWDYQWQYSIWKTCGISILPNENLVRNIGFGTNATHTTAVPDRIPEIMGITNRNIIHPSEVLIEREADHYTFRKYYFQRQPVLQSVITRFKQLRNKL